MSKMDRDAIRKRIISATLDEDVVREMERVKKETGVSVSAQIQLALKGYRVVPAESRPYPRRQAPHASTA